MKSCKIKVYFLSAVIFSFICVPFYEAFATDFSIDGVFFNEKMPSKKDNIQSSLFNYDVSVAILRNDVGAINSSLVNGYSVKVVGFTDNRECSGKECEALSLRRAELIYKWMIANGVPKSRLLPPEGHGSGEPIADNEIPEGRARNRAVGFELVPNSP